MTTKRVSAIAIAICSAAVSSSATVVERPLAQTSPAFARSATQNSTFAWTGRWQGTTASGGQLVLQLQLQGEQLSGRLTVGKQSAKIVYGKVVGEAFALTTDPIDGHTVDATGRRVGDAIELTIEGVEDPMTLTRLN